MMCVGDDWATVQVHTASRQGDEDVQRIYVSNAMVPLGVQRSPK